MGEGLTWEKISAIIAVVGAVSGALVTGVYTYVQFERRIEDLAMQVKELRSQSAVIKGHSGTGGGEAANEKQVQQQIVEHQGSRGEPGKEIYSWHCTCST